jgi:hypothetical protein
MDTAMSGSDSSVPTRQTTFDYDRTVVAFHGTRRASADALVCGAPFSRSENDDDWLGHGTYFWEHAPQQAWWWAAKRYGDADSAVVGALIRLGRCLDLLDPANSDLLRSTYEEMSAAVRSIGRQPKQNGNHHKFMDCFVFNLFFDKLERAGYAVESTRAVFVPTAAGKGLDRLWLRSGVFGGSHIQLSIREPSNILAVWHVRRDGRYGKNS